MERFFEFSKSQRKTLTLLGLAMIVIGGYKVIETYAPGDIPHPHTPRGELADDYRPPLVLDVNHSPADSLELAPGIGPVLARRIVEYRRKHGCFASVDSLIHVRGIGPVTLEKMRSYFRNVTP